MTAGVEGEMIGGGGTADDPNRLADSYSMIGGGAGNLASRGDDDPANATFATVGGGGSNQSSGFLATVPGGRNNSAAGDHSRSAGRRAKANNPGCFVWADSTNADVACNTTDRFIARASGGVYLYTSGDLSKGAYLPANCGSWASLSDRAAKAHLATIDPVEILRRLVSLPIQR